MRLRCLWCLPSSSATEAPHGSPSRSFVYHSTQSKCQGPTWNFAIVAPQTTEALRYFAWLHASFSTLYRACGTHACMRLHGCIVATQPWIPTSLRALRSISCQTPPHQHTFTLLQNSLDHNKWNAIDSSPGTSSDTTQTEVRIGYSLHSRQKLPWLQHDV